jgi:hypothetical protein
MEAMDEGAAIEEAMAVDLTTFVHVNTDWIAGECRADPEPTPDIEEQVAPERTKLFSEDSAMSH